MYYEVLISDGPLPIDWAVDGEVWDEALADELSLLGATSISFARLPPPDDDTVEVRSDGPLDGVLRYQDGPSGVDVFIVSDHALSAEHLSVWEYLVSEAADRTGFEEKRFSWAAVISTEVQHDGTPPLEAKAQVGPLTLEPSAGLYWESSVSAARGFGRPRLGWANAIHVSGPCLARNWAGVQRAAGNDLYRIIALLSLTTNTPWDLIHEVVPSETVLDVSDSVRGIRDSDRIPTPAEWTRDTLSLPHWIESGWTMATKAPIEGALSAWYDAVSMSQRMWPRALALYVAAVEAIGSAYVDLELCPECGGQKGAGRRFRKALRLVATPAETKRLFNAYGMRSTVAHGDRLEDHLLILGAGLPSSSFFGADPEFRLHRTTRKMRDLSRSLLIGIFDHSIALPPS